VEEHLTVGRVAELAGVTVRTLHHYDEIGLVQPSARTAAGYRAYSAGDVERLREVLAYRRLGFGLREIADLVGDPATDAVAHLRLLDGLFEAYWRRPEAYLDDHVRRAVSMWTRIGPEAEQRAVRSLRDDLASGRWTERNRELADLDAAELGLRLLIA
jgi:DNA-binding transcriptional MerR regulator